MVWKEIMKKKEKKPVHWVVDTSGKIACRSLRKVTDLGSFSLRQVTCKKCLKTKEAKKLRG